MSGEPRSKPMFREEALRHHAAGTASEGEILRILPGWADRTYYLLILVVATTLLYAAFSEVNVYATGPAVVRMQGRSELTASTAGVVRAVDVRPGQLVEAGAALVRLNDAQPRAELDRVSQEFDLQLVRAVRDPSDEVARGALTTLRAQRDLAAARLEELVIRAPRAGVIVDLRVREGQQLAPGDPLLSIAGRDERPSIIALLPGHVAPQLRPGTPLRFEITGYRYAYQDLAIESIGSEVLGPAEARRYLGPDMGDALTIDGPVVLVHARPPAATFVSQGMTFSYLDGMVGRAEARLDAERLLVTLIPYLKALRESRRGRRP